MPSQQDLQRDHHGLFVAGNTVLGVIVVLWVWGVIICRPFRPPRLPSLLLWVYFLYCLGSIWVLPNTPVSNFVHKLNPRLIAYDYDLLLFERIFMLCFLVALLMLWKLLAQRVKHRLSQLPFVNEVMRKDLQGGKHARPLDVLKMQTLARQLALTVDGLTDSATYHPVLVALCKRRRVQVQREAVSRLLELCDRQEVLDFAVLRTNVAQLLAFGSPKSRDLLFKRSTDENCNWSKEARAVLVDALQKNGRMLRSNRLYQEWIVRIITSVNGTELMMMLHMIDSGGDYHSLMKLVYQDIRSIELREQLLAHFHADGASCEPGSHDFRRKVLSDIDDTLYSSGGHFPAGVDSRLPKGSVYPGILKLYSELDVQSKITSLMKSSAFFKQRASTNVDCTEGFTNLVFLSARPHLHSDWSERITYRLFRQLILEGRMHAMPTLTPGHLWTCLGAVIGALLKRPNAWERVGRLKFENMRRLKALYPHYEFVFFGDNGQGDLLAAELALAADPPLVSVAFINEVTERSRCLTTVQADSDNERNERWERLGVRWIRTPVDAAVESCRRQLISLDGLGRVCDAAIEDMEALAVTYPCFGNWQERFDELNASLQQAQALNPNIKVLDNQQVLELLGELCDEDVIETALSRSFKTMARMLPRAPRTPRSAAGQEPLVEP